jgi:hypothetical protein
MRPAPPRATLYSVTPLRAAALPANAQQQELQPESGSTAAVQGPTHGDAGEVQEAEEWKAKIARLPPTPPVPHDPGSEILRAVATILLVVHAEHALRSTRENREGAQSGDDEHEGDGYGDASSEQADKPREHISGTRELKQLYEEWKPVWQTLASVGCIGEWRMSDILRPVS